jgi:hypothetical protein
LFFAKCVEKPAAVTEREKRIVVSVTVKPEKVYIQRSDSGQHLNFDFILKNQIDENLIINKVELLVFDETDKLARREFYDEYGRRALEATAETRIEKQASMLFYNPFHTFTADIPLKRLRYEFSFSSEDRSKYFKTVVDVAPVFYETKTDLILPVGAERKRLFQHLPRKSAAPNVIIFHTLRARLVPIIINARRAFVIQALLINNHKIISTALKISFLSLFDETLLHIIKPLMMRIVIVSIPNEHSAIQNLIIARLIRLN